MSLPADRLQQERDALQAAVSWARPLLETIERDAELTHVRRVRDKPLWFVRVKPSLSLQDGFGLAPELLVVLVAGEVQARDLHVANDEVARSGLCLDGNLVVVADAAAHRGPLAERLERIAGHGQRVALVPRSNGTWPTLKRIFTSTLPTFDAYEDRDPVRGAQLVGRTAEVSSLRTRVTRGEAVALLGLRKMGKTSIMRAVTDWFDPASAMREPSLVPLEASPGVAIVVDASTIIDRTVDGVADELRSALRRRMRAAGEPATEPSAAGLTGLKRAVEALLDADRAVAIVLDEFDLLFEGESGEPPAAGISKLFRLIRGWSQTYQGRVSLMLVGRDPTFLSQPEIEGVTSPLLAWCSPYWIGPLGKDQANELLRKIGRRVGLEVGHATANLALEWTGGHPLLHRQFGSALRGVIRKADGSWGVSTEPYAGAALPPFRQRDGVLDVLREVQALLTKRYPRAWRVLADLACGASWAQAMEAVGGLEARDARLLVDLGLAHPDRNLALALTWYIRDVAVSSVPSRKAG